MIRTLEKQLKSIIPNVALRHPGVGTHKEKESSAGDIYRTVVLKLQESQWLRSSKWEEEQ